MFIFLYSSLIGFTQNPKISLKDSLTTEKLQRDGVRLARLGDYEAALTKFDSINQIRRSVYGEKSVRLVSPLNNIGIQYKNLQNFDSFSFDVLTAEELSLVKGGKSEDIYIDLN